MIDLRYVKKLIEMIDESSVDSIEISSDKGMKIRISKSPQQRGTLQVAAPLPVPAMLPSAVAGRATPGEGQPAAGSLAEADQSRTASSEIRPEPTQIEKSPVLVRIVRKFGNPARQRLL